MPNPTWRPNLYIHTYIRTYTLPSQPNLIYTRVPSPGKSYPLLLWDRLGNNGSLFLWWCNEPTHSPWLWGKLCPRRRGRERVLPFPPNSAIKHHLLCWGTEGARFEACFSGVCSIHKQNLWPLYYADPSTTTTTTNLHSRFKGDRDDTWRIYGYTQHGMKFFLNEAITPVFVITYIKLNS